MTHLWLRAEQRDNENRVGLTPQGAAELIGAGIEVTVEESPHRCIALEGYVEAGCSVAPQNSWPTAPPTAFIFGLKELPEDETPLPHRHIMFGHAFKGQPAGQRLLARFQKGGGALYDLEYLQDEQGRRLAAFGYWAGFAGAAVALKCYAAQHRNEIARAMEAYADSAALLTDLKAECAAFANRHMSVLIIGALGRVGTGAADLCREMGLSLSLWDMAETAGGGPFPEVLEHDIFLNCILAHPATPVFLPETAKTAPRRLRVIGDIACDPESDFSPVKVYNQATSWANPALRVHDAPPLDVTAIDNLPSLLPKESSLDFASQLLPALLKLPDHTNGAWARALNYFHKALQPTS